MGCHRQWRDALVLPQRALVVVMISATVVLHVACVSGIAAAEDMGRTLEMTLAIASTAPVVKDC